MLRRFVGTSLLAALVGLGVGSANANPTAWTVQSGSSSLTISGALSSGGTLLANLVTQGAGSLTTKYTGTINSLQGVAPISTDGWSGNPTSIQFLSATLTALNSGNWDPLPGGALGTAGANYGGKVDLGFLGGANLSVRSLSAGLASGAIALSGTAYGAQSFSGNVDVSLLSATADYRGYGIVGGALGSGSLTSGIAGQSGTITSAGGIAYSGGYAGTATLTIPVNFDFAAIVAGGDTTDVADDIGVFINLLGTIVATSATSAVPEANSIVLLGLAGSVVGFLGYRRKTKNVA